MKPTKSICVFCGARAGNDPAFLQEAKILGSGISNEGWRLVFGAGDIGIMGAVAEAVETAGGKTMGIIPQHLVDMEAANQDLENLIITEDMHSRKKLMFTNSDAVVVFPGGAGSLDEFFEVLTWAQIGLHNRPIILSNIKGYWTPLVTLIDHIIEQGFASASLRDYFQVCNSAEETLDALRSSLTAA